MTGKHEKDHATQEEAEKPKKTVKPGSRRPVVLVAVILCSIIMVGSILLPSLSAIVSGVNNSKQQAHAAAETAAAEAETADAATTDAATTEAADTATAQSTVLDNINSRYSGTVETLESKLSENPQDAATLINLANNYYPVGELCDAVCQLRRRAAAGDRPAHQGRGLLRPVPRAR